MVRLNKKLSEQFLSVICQNDSTLCNHIKLLVLLKRSGRLSTYYAHGDLNAQTTITVAGNVKMGSIISQLTCDPNYNECDL